MHPDIENLALNTKAEKDGSAGIMTSGVME
jgi:hypothetical protein